MKFKKIYFLCIFLLFMYSFIKNHAKYVPIEELDIPVGLGYDLILNRDNDTIYDIPLELYNFGHGGDQPVTTLILSGKGSTIGETREDRQRKSSRKFIIGTERIILMQDSLASIGIYDIINVLFTNSLVNDEANAVITKGKTIDMFKFKIPGYTSSSDYIDGMLKSSVNYNFFSDNYKMIDMYTRIVAEGRQLVLPYLEIDKDRFKITGMAIFNDDKLSYIVNLSDAKIMNLLRENDVKGVITLKDGFGNNTDLYASSTRKVKCTKENDNYTFYIDLSLKTDIIQNGIYKDLQDSPQTMSKMLNDAEIKLKKQCYSFIDKMQEDIKIDCLELGRVGAATYGRNLGIDWDEVVTNAKINVNINIVLDKTGRGRY